MTIHFAESVCNATIECYVLGQPSTQHVEPVRVLDTPSNRYGMAYRVGLHSVLDTAGRLVSGQAGF